MICALCFLEKCLQPDVKFPVHGLAADLRGLGSRSGVERIASRRGASAWNVINGGFGRGQKVPKTPRTRTEPGSVVT